jgi:hypothetical protein
MTTLKWINPQTKETFGIRLNVVILMAKTAFAASEAATDNVASYILAPSLSTPSRHYICLLPAQMPHLLVEDTHPP